MKSHVCLLQTCMQCSPPMLLGNSCSAAAHRRLHQKLTPLVCPECGLVFRPHNVNTHVQQACLHYTRQLGYRYGASSHQYLKYYSVRILNWLHSFDKSPS